MFRDDLGELGSTTKLGGASMAESHKTHMF